MAGISSLRSKTALCDAAGPASWGGANGIEAQFVEVADLLLERGVKVLENLTTLASLTGADAGIVAVKGGNLYVYNPNGTTTSVLDYPASGGGRWQYLASLGPTSFAQIIGDSIETVFTITHNLNTLYPTVLQLETLTGLPYAYSTEGVVTVEDANTVVVTYVTPPGSFQYTIAVKK